MDDITGGREGRRGREARKTAREKRGAVSIPYITRSIPVYNVLSEEGLSISKPMPKPCSGKRHRNPRISPRHRIAGEGGRGGQGRARAYSARAVPPADEDRAEPVHPACAQPERSVVIGGNNTVFAPVYGSPFVHDIEKGRRYGTIEDFQNFVKLAYMSGPMHHSGGTVCASRSICPSTSGISRWSMPISNTPTSRSWGLSPRRNGRRIR